MKICFVLPRFARGAVGGHKIIYEYANGLVKKGYDISILFLNEDAFTNYKLPYPFKVIAAKIMTLMQPRWFALDKKIKKVSGLDIKAAELKKYDIVIATAINTVTPVIERFSSSKKIYFIQDYENWNESNEKVNDTYSMGMVNVVVSEWLKEKVDRYSKKPAVLIKNPIDLNVYREIVPVVSRKKYTVAMLYHPAKHKGIKYAIEALKFVKEECLDLTVEMFGTYKIEEKLPPWIHYTKNASKEETVKIYNSCQVFLCASIEEGYGLTGLEAMACGTVLVSTNYRGVREYAVDGYNALLSNIKNSRLLANNILRIFNNETLMMQISKNGISTVQNFSWEKALHKMETVLEKCFEE